MYAINVIQLYWINLIILKFMKRKKGDHIGSGSYKRGRETEMKNNKLEGIKRIERRVEKFNEIA